MNSTFRFPSAITLLAFFAICLPSAKAETLLTFKPGQPTTFLTGNFSGGNAFTIGSSALAVTELGAYVGPNVSNGVSTLAFTVDVFAYTNSGAQTGTLLDTATVAIGTTVDSQGFAYVASTAHLAPGLTYSVIDNGIGGSAVYAITDNSTYSANIGPGATFATSLVSNNGNPATTYPYVGTFGGTPQRDYFGSSFGAQFVGSNLQYNVTPAPEPSSLAYLILGALVLAVTLRKKSTRS